jgi:hypothetical protein
MSKQSISRRSFIKGSGAAISLPLLSAMVGSRLAEAAVSGPKRIGFVYVPQGMVMTRDVDMWTPSSTGTDFELTPTLEPLAKFKSRLTVVSNLSGPEGGGQHAGAAATWLTDSELKMTERSDVEACVSIDQIIAARLGKETMVPSVQLAVEDVSDLKGFWHTGYNYRYLNTISWRSPTEVLRGEIKPRAVFDQLFSARESSAQRAFTRRSILDTTEDSTQDLLKRLGVADRLLLSEYLENIRQVERRIGAAEVSETPLEYRERAGIMFDLMHLAYQADVTRVVSMMMAREISHLRYSEIDVNDSHHALSHHQNSPETMASLGKINRYHVQLFSDFVAKLDKTPDGEGSLLDHTLLVYGSGMSNGNDHDSTRLPIALVGGLVAGNRHIRLAPTGRPLGDLHVDIAKVYGVELPAFGQRNHGETVGLS